MAKDNGRVCYDGSESGLRAAINSGGREEVGGEGSQARYNSKSTGNYDNPVTGTLGSKGGSYSKGQTGGVGPYTDSDDHVTPLSGYNDVDGDGGTRSPDLKRATTEAEAAEDYIQPIYPARGLAQKLPKR